MSLQFVDQDIYDQQRVADFRTVRKTVRASGIGSIIFGVIAVGVGAVMISQNPINAILLLLGVVLLATGIINCVNPTPTGIIVDGITLLLLGAWNVFVLIANSQVETSNNHSTGSLPVIAVFQIIYGIASFSRYKRFAEAYAVHPSANALREMDEMLKAIWKAKAKDSREVMQFTAQSFNRQNVWKARLLPDRAVFVMAGGQDAVIVSKEEAAISITGKALLGKSRKAEFRLGNRTLKASLAPDMLDRFNTWKTGHYEPVLMH